MARFYTSPSRIARYFFHDCERQLRFGATPIAARAAEGVPKIEFDVRPLRDVVLETGYEWEERVVETHLSGRVAIAAPTSKARSVRDRVHTVDDTLELLETTAVGHAIYQPSFAPPPRFYARFGLDPSLVEFRENRPDLLTVVAGRSSPRRLRVIDIKASDALKTTHRVQVALYALELAALVEEHGIDAEVDLDEAGIWLAGADTPEPFDLSLVRPHVEKFLREDLSRILSQPASEAAWHLFFRCEWCDYYAHCREEAERTRNVSLLPYLSREAKRFLGTHGVGTLPELKTFLERKDADEVLAQAASLAGKRLRLVEQVTSLTAGVLRAHGGTVLAMPVSEHVRVVVTLHAEPARGEVYAYGVHVQPNKPLAAELDLGDTPNIYLAEREGDGVAARRAFLARLHEICTRIDAYNSQRSEWKDQITAQVYVYDAFEERLLLEELVAALDDPKAAQTALALLFHFQDEDAVQAEKHGGEEVFFPVVVLTEAVQRLFALPIPVAYRLSEVLPALTLPGEKAFEYEPRDYFHFPLSNRLRSDAIYAAWYRGDAAKLQSLEKELRRRLWATTELIWKIRARARDRLVAWPPRFRMPKALDIDNPTLSRLAFMTRYESVMQCLGTREVRTVSHEEARGHAAVVPLEALGGNRFRVQRDVTDLDESPFLSWLLVPASDQGLRDALAFHDYRFRDKWFGPRKDAPVSLAKITASRVAPTTELVREITLDLVGGELSTRGASKGSAYFLLPRHTDHNTERVIGFLRELAAEKSPWFVKLLKTPKSACGDLDLPADASRQVAKRSGKLEFTRSQSDAFERVCKKRATFLWGPPGTGKTHLLASTIATLVDAHARVGRPFRVLVSAFTHAAIENVLRAVQKRQNGANAVLTKLDHWSTPLAGAATWDAKQLEAELEKEPLAVVGGTAYAIYKGNVPKLFDLVIVDEASQLRVPEAAIPLSARTKAGRLILAGDDMQLPPIVQGVYPDPPDGEPRLHRSIFEVVKTRAARDDVSQLLENFRMNDVLTKFVARQIYGDRYCCASDAIARRRLPWSLKTPDPSGLVGFALDPRYPLVLAVLEGVSAARENPLEAALVADLVLALRAGLRRDDGKPFPDSAAGDEAFFRDGVFIVSPHRVQIGAIRRGLASRRTWKATPFVDTVDKMQGQEADAVLVSYGVADAEFAKQEAEFLYSRNRLNVSITRARSKCVVFLPKPLLDASPDVLDSDEVAEGLGFMRALFLHCERTGERREFKIDGAPAARLVVWRTDAR